MFYFGFLAGLRLNPLSILKLSIVLVLIEVFLINTFVDYSSMPNFYGGESSVSKYFGFYYRPNGFGGNSTVSSVIIVSLMAYCYKALSLKWKTLSVASILLIYSMTGVALLFLIALIQLKSVKSIFFISMAIILLLLVFMNDWRMSSDYIEVVLSIKLGQMYEFIGYGISKLMGLHNFDDIIFTGDFAILDFLLGVGLLMGIIYSFLFLTNFQIFIPLIILLVGSFHYPVLFSMPGQILFAYYLACGKKYIPSDYA